MSNGKVLDAVLAEGVRVLTDVARLCRPSSNGSLVSGLGQAVLGRALADPEWVEARLRDLSDTDPSERPHVLARP